MSVFSNLEGTMQPSFILGKKGALISFSDDSISIKDSFGEKFLPVKVGSAVDADSAVNVKYLEDHPTVMFGEAIPSDDIGKNNYTYFQTNSEGIVDIFLKIDGKWVKSLYVNKDILSSVNGRRLYWIDNRRNTSTSTVLCNS
ncbi:hypothetical protein [Escherichia phage vB_EcoM_JNE01]|nr:hypothetical protein [Escherichia phage vB_EcoM_JNE01]